MSAMLKYRMLPRDPWMEWGCRYASAYQRDPPDQEDTAMISNKIKIVLFSVIPLYTGAVVLAHAEPTIHCEIPLAVVCNVQDDQGIKNIVVQVDTNLGPINVADQDYNRCVTEATVQWDPIVPNYEIVVTNCDPELPPRGRIKGFVTAVNHETRVVKAAPYSLLTPRNRRPHMQFPADLPAFVAQRPGGNAIVAGCGHSNVKCGELPITGDSCGVESESEKASCPGTVEENPGLGTVCVASC